MSKRQRLTQGNDSSSEEDNVFTVAAVLNKRTKGSKSEFLIKWEGFTDEEATWEPEDNLSCHELIAEYHRGVREKKEAEKKAMAKEAAASVESTSDDTKSKADEKFNLDEKQLRCIIGMTKAPGELHFLCKFTDDTATLLPAKEVNNRYREYVDVYADFVRDKVEKRQRRMERSRSGKPPDPEDEEDEWPEMPEGIEILTKEEREQKLAEKQKAEKLAAEPVLDAVEMIPLVDITSGADADMINSQSLSNFATSTVEEPPMNLIDEPMLNDFVADAQIFGGDVGGQDAQSKYISEGIVDFEYSQPPISSIVVDTVAEEMSDEHLVFGQDTSSLFSAGPAPATTFDMEVEPEKNTKAESREAPEPEPVTAAEVEKKEAPESEPSTMEVDAPAETQASSSDLPPSAKNEPEYIYEQDEYDE